MPPPSATRSVCHHHPTQPTTHKMQRTALQTFRFRRSRSGPPGSQAGGRGTQTAADARGLNQRRQRSGPPQTAVKHQAGLRCKGSQGIGHGLAMIASQKIYTGSRRAASGRALAGQRDRGPCLTSCRDGIGRGGAAQRRTRRTREGPGSPATHGGPPPSGRHPARVGSATLPDASVRRRVATVR